MKLYNTLSRQKEEFVPIEKTVKMYSCGPTVYNFAHIGNLRTYIFMDMLRKGLKYFGFKIKGVMNITDVGHLLSDADDGEDKMVKASREQQKSPYEIAEFYTNIFKQDLKKLNIDFPELMPKATDHIKEMIKFVEGLIEKGFAYELEDGIYFDIAKFENYGKLSRLNLEEQIAGARVEVNQGKRHPADFALWKKAPKEHIMRWESPWGLGYPGWHIECSAMSKKYLGDTFDIHTGGVDHIPVHHENEIAQSEALNNKPFVNYWLHGEFMLVDGGKMSKKLGNTYTLDQLSEMGYSAMDFRYFCLNAHYRKKLNFTFEGLEAAKVSYSRLMALVLQHKNGSANQVNLNEFKSEFENAISDDVNVPLALGVLWEMLKTQEKNVNVYKMALEFDKVLSLSLDKAQIVEEKIDVPCDIVELCEKRIAAKKEKNYALADEIRKQIEDKGFIVVDVPGGYQVKMK